MRILMIGLTPPEEGGSQRHIYEIGQRIKDVDVLTQKGSSCSKKIELSVWHKNSLFRNLSFALMCYIYALKLLFVKKYELIHIHENTLYPLVPLLRFRYKVIVTVHGIEGFKFYENKILWIIFRNFLKFANEIIAVSKEDKIIFDKYFKKVSYIPNGVDLSVYKKINPQVEKKITFIGRIHEQKGIIYLLEAFESIKDKFPDFKLEIIGKINDYAIELQKKFPDKRIVWKGFVSDRMEIVKSLKSAYCIVLPSLWEGLPLTLFEALASGRPVIVSDIKSFKTIVKNEVLFCEVKNSEEISKNIIKLIESEKLTQDLSKKGQVLIKKFDWNNLAKTTFKTYQNSLK